MEESAHSKIAESRTTDSASAPPADFTLRVLDALPELVYITNSDYQIEYANKAFRDEFGPIDSRRCFALLNQRSEPCPWCPNPRVFAGEQVRWEWPFPSGNVYDVLSSPLPSNANRLASLSVLHNATALRERDLRYSALFRSAGDAILITKDNQLMDCNDRALELFGCTREQFLYQSGSRFSPPRQPDGRSSDEVGFELASRALREGSARFEWRHSRLDGTPFDAEVSLNALPLPDPGWMLAIVRDVSQRKAAEEELRQTRDRLDAIFRASPLAILVFDRAHVVQQCNPAAERILGFQALEILGKPLGPESDNDDFRLLRDRAANGEEILDAELEFHRVNGSPVDVRVSLALLRNAQAQHVSTLAMIQDITETKRHERERIRLETQFQHSQKMESIGRLAGGIAHDFNNLLTVISGHVSVALATVDPNAPVRQQLNVVADAASRAATLTRQLLTFSRKEAAQPRKVAIDDLVRSMHPLVTRVLGEDIQVTTRLESNASALLDPHQLEGVLLNLVANARDALPNGGVLTLETSLVTLSEDDCHRRPGLTPGQQVMLSITDNGVGMTQEVKNHLFEPFFTTKPPSKGTGLGLAMVYGSVTQNGGAIEVESEPGRGTSLRLFFPALTTVETTPAPDDSPKTPQNLEGITILLVEDDPQLRGITDLMLRKLKCSVLVSASGQEALALSSAYKGEIDVLLTDVVMPGMNGRELALRLVDQRKSTKVLYTSGYATEVLAHHGVLEPGLILVPKPYTLGELATKIREALGH